MAKGRRGKRGGKGKKDLRDRPIPNKKIEKKSTKKKDLTLVASTSAHPITIPTPNTISNGNRITKQSKKKDEGDDERLTGFIFMCSGKTKPECYKYRVFGLPAGKRDVVENIKPGTKLFLFDFDLKLLYGVYKATSSGGYGLEPTAFRGRFPAQVRFKIYTDCLPLPESEFKHAIRENYQSGSKFTPELSNKQVKKLIAMFRPISLAPAGPPPSSVVPSQGRPLIVEEDRFQPPARLPPREDPYAAPPARMPPREDPYARPARLPPLEDPYLAPPARLPPREDPYLAPPARLPPRENPYALPPARLRPQEDPYAVGTQHGRAPVALEPRHLQPIDLLSHHDPYFSGEPRQAYLPEIRPLPSQDPYGRYRTVPEFVQREQIPGREGEYHRLLLERERGIVSHLDRPDDYHNQIPARVASHAQGSPYGLAPVSALVHAPSYAPSELPVYQTNSYYTTEDPNRVYADRLQRSVSGRVGLAGENLSVSSLYSFAGTAPAYR